MVMGIVVEAERSEEFERVVEDEEEEVVELVNFPQLPLWYNH